MIQSNILDPIEDCLDRTVFDDACSPEPKLKPVHAKWILDTVIKTLKKNGYTHMEDWLSIVLTGSLTTYQYSKDSDTDISLFVDSEHFPEWSRAEMIGIMVGNIDGTYLPGTTHPMQCFVVPPGVTKETLYQPGLRSGYDIQEKRWIVPPEKNRVHNVEAEMNGYYVYALEAADKMERLLKYEPDKAIQYWHSIHKRRQRDQRAGKGDYSESNIVYKFLNNRGLMPQIADVSGEYIAKVATIADPDEAGAFSFRTEYGSDEYQYSAPWKPGYRGKGVIMKNGDIIHWRTNKDDEPHHDTAVTSIGLDPDKVIHYIDHIDSDGTTFFDPGYSRYHQAMKDAGLRERDPWKLSNLQPFFVDERAVEKARQHLGLEHPVNVQMVNGTQGGYNYPTDEYPGHHIQVVNWLKPESASKQIWHELQHAKQWEQDPEGFQSGQQEYHDTRSQGYDAYFQHPWELDANEIANQHPFLLALPSKHSQRSVPPHQREAATPALR